MLVLQFQFDRSGVLWVDWQEIVVHLRLVFQLLCCPRY